MSDYQELEVQARKGGLAVIGPVSRGQAASQIGAAMLMEATGADSVEGAIKIAMGRPKVGAAQGPSPVVRARVTRSVKDRLDRLAAARQATESDIVREAINLYLAAQPA